MRLIISPIIQAHKLVFDRRGFIVFSGADQISAFGSFYFVVSLCFAINVKVDFLKVLRFSFPVPVVSSPARFCRRKHKKVYCSRFELVKKSGLDL